MDKTKLDALRIDRGSRPGRISLAWPLIGLVVFILVLLLAGSRLLPARPTPVRVAKVEQRTGKPGERIVLNASGYVVARREATVSSKVTGKVVEVMVEEGIKVQQGQILARLDDTNVRASLELAQARLHSASNTLAETSVRIREAEKELARQTNLLASRIAAAVDYDRAEATAHALAARLEVQKADILVAQREVESWRQQLDDTIIRAPFAGIVTSKNAQPGEMISPISAGGGYTRTGICTIVDMESLEIEIDVNESYINRVEPAQGAEATLDAYPEWKIPCKVIAIIPTADRQKSTVRVRVGFEKLDKRILPQMSVKVGFRDTGSGQSGGPAIVIPAKSIRKTNGRDSVFVVTANHAERRDITVVRFEGLEAVVSSGVTPGESVIMDSDKPLADKVAVQVGGKR